MNHDMLHVRELPFHVAMDVLRDLMPKKSTDFASYWKGKEKQVKRILKTTAKELKENMNQ